jgi:hypothetical protein
MENIETFAPEQVAENVEQTTEQTPKTYTQEEVDAIVGKRLARKEARIRKEYDRKYGDLEEVLKAGTGKESVEEVTDTFKQFYQKKGIQFPTKPAYTDNDIEVLAQAEANDIIRSGFEDVVEEVDRLADIGVANMTAREKAVFKVLADHRQKAERGRELTKIGVTEEVYESKEFKDFASKFNATTPIRDIYDIYQKTQPKKEIKPMGSMKNSTSEDGMVKDFYTPDEARSFSRKYLDEHPDVYKAIVNSMPRWK